MARWFCLTTLVLLALSVMACTGAAKFQIVGKWEATITHKPSGNVSKVEWEFLPDGTFTVAPLGDPTAIVDKSKYEIIENGEKIKFRSQLVDEVTCTFNGSTITGETSENLIRFKKL